MIRPRGVALLIVAIVLFVLAGTTRVGWLLLFEAVLWGTLVVSAVMPWLATGDLDVGRRVAGRPDSDGKPGPMEGDALAFGIVLRNRGLLPCMLATVLFNCRGETLPPSRERLFLAWLGRGRDVSCSTRVVFPRRGRYELPPVKIETALPFGLFRKSVRMGESAQLVILSKVYPVGPLDTLGNAGPDELQPLPARTGEQTLGSRDYAPGDPYQHIHWRNTARLARLQTREFERIPEGSLTIIIGPHRSNTEGGEALEAAIKIAASVGDLVCRSGGTVRLVGGGIDRLTADRTDLLTELALMEDAGHAPWALAATLTGPTSVMAILLDSDTPGLEILTRFAEGGASITSVLSRSPEPGPSPAGDTQRLRGAGAILVECREGDVRAALADLAQARLGFSPGTIQRSSATGAIGLGGR